MALKAKWLSGPFYFYGGNMAKDSKKTKIVSGMKDSHLMMKEGSRKSKGGKKKSEKKK